MACLNKVCSLVVFFLLVGVDPNDNMVGSEDVRLLPNEVAFLVFNQFVVLA